MTVVARGSAHLVLYWAGEAPVITGDAKGRRRMKMGGERPCEVEICSMCTEGPTHRGD